MTQSTYPKVSNRSFGIEVEFISELSRDDLVDSMNTILNEVNSGMRIREAYYSDSSNEWRIKDDGSLSGSGWGAELVSPILYGIEGVEQLEIMLKVLNSHDVSINVSCGLHVHLGAQDLTYHEIISVMDRYSEFEPQVDMIMAESRRGDNAHYARPIGAGYIGRLKRNAKSKSRLAYAGDRYRKVNLESLSKHGTLEFRHHSGTSNFEKIVSWLSFLMTFVEVSRKLSNSKRRQPAKARKSHHHLAKEFFATKGWSLEFHRGMSPRGMNHFEVINSDGVGVDWVDGLILDECYVNGEFSYDQFSYLFAEVAEKLSEVRLEPQAEMEIEPEELVDEGWLMDVDEKVVSYFNERQLELNS